MAALVEDAGDFTLVGPGARRGLNRIAGRDVDWGSRGAERALAEARFLEEVRLVHAFCVRERPAWCAARNIDIHDVQFQLCEFDKYERVKSAKYCSAILKYEPLASYAFAALPKPPCRDFEHHVAIPRR